GVHSPFPILSFPIYAITPSHSYHIAYFTLMDLDQIKQILELVREHALSEFELEQGDFRVKIRKDSAGALVAAPSIVVPTASPPSVAAAPAAAAQAGAPAPPPVDEDVELAVVKSPIVGTFYRAPEPEAAAFVEIGSSVK